MTNKSLHGWWRVISSKTWFLSMSGQKGTIENGLHNELEMMMKNNLERITTFPQTQSWSMFLMLLIMESSCRTSKHALAHLAKRIIDNEDNSQKMYCSMMTPHEAMLSYLDKNMRYPLHEITHLHYQRPSGKVKNQL